MNAPVTRSASERYAALKIVLDLLARTEQAMSAIGDPPGAECRECVLDLMTQTRHAVSLWIDLERERLS